MTYQVIPTNSAFNQVQAHGDTSSKYAFIPTSRVSDVLADYGWFPSRYTEGMTRKSENQGFQKHVVRFRQEPSETRNVGDEFAEIVVVNSHMGTASFTLNLGMFRLVCKNGAVVSTQNFQSHKIRHVGFAESLVETSLRQLTGDIPKLLDNVQTWKSVNLSLPEKHAFADSVIELVNDGEKFAMQSKHVLQPRRYADTSDDLWTVFNRVQENIIRGGVPRSTTDGRRQSTRAVKSVDQNIKLNQALWSLTEKMAELKAAN